MTAGACNSVCHRYKSKLPWFGNPTFAPIKAKYYCATCKFPFDGGEGKSGNSCPCCHMRMRLKVRNNAARKQNNSKEVYH